MNITVSYFASKAPASRKVCIAKKPYRFLPKLPQAVNLAPSNPWAENWQQAYRADLDARFPSVDDLRRELEAICRETPYPVLCCYEKHPEECHRSILAAYIEEKLGFAVLEWQANAQLSL